VRTRITIGVTAITLLVLAGLLLVAVRQVRDSAAKSGCKNNLWSLALALSSYSDSYGYFPTATFGPTDVPPNRRLSWMFELDPFIHARMDPEWVGHKNETWDSEPIRKLARQRMLWIRCPVKEDELTSEGYALTTYAGSTGVGIDSAALAKEDPRSGFFGLERRIKPSDIKDGAANTISILETGLDNGPWIAGGPPTVRFLELEGPPLVGVGGQFGGFHRRGMMVVCADAAVRFIPESIGPGVLAASLTIAGRQQTELLWTE
jgi:hypothetical protein